ncbi:unnamed protein product [Fusarium fujikuroi]|uniref:Uncharacterized protein n=1 Tax=Fusarium fujikuroi TaxID=5127 RepID=A0A9Q9RXY4_FUSFU|nr:unnamed protein product [Fusarium fujikuroi]
MPIFVRRFVSKVFAGEQGSATTLINSNRCFFIAIAAITFRGSLKSDFFVAVFIRDRKALISLYFRPAFYIIKRSLETLKEKKATKEKYKKERLNTFI